MTQQRRLRRLEQAAAQLPEVANQVGDTASDSTRAAGREAFARFLVECGDVATIEDGIAWCLDAEAEVAALGVPPDATLEEIAAASVRSDGLTAEERADAMRGASDMLAEFEAWCRLRQAPPA